MADDKVREIDPDKEWEGLNQGSQIGHHRDGSPVSPFPDNDLPADPPHFTNLNQPELTEEELAAVQKANKGDAGTADPRIIGAHELRTGQAKGIEKFTKAGQKRQADAEKASEAKAAEEATPVRVVKK